MGTRDLVCHGDVGGGVIYFVQQVSGQGGEKQTLCEG